MAPYSSEKQKKWMHANKPEMAERWDKEEKTKSYKLKKLARRRKEDKYKEY